jgi:hypothetical protein
MSISQNFPTDLPTLNLDFVNNQFLDPRITFTRTSSATYFNSSGVLTTAANNVPRFDYDPATFVPRGFSIEEQRTNSIRNNTMQGAVAGTPGTLPTNWTAATSGLTRTVVGTGTSNGITYIDVRFAGTSTNTFAGVYFEASNGVAATNGQTWTPSAWVSVVGGSTANITSAWLQVDQYNNVPTYLSSLSGTNVVSLLNSTPTRYSVALTTNNASTAFIVPSFSIFFANGAAIDITLRIGLPQLEQGFSATSVIPTTNVAVTRNADTATMTGTNFSSWFNPAEGVLIVENTRFTGNGDFSATVYGATTAQYMAAGYTNSSGDITNTPYIRNGSANSAQSAGGANRNPGVFKKDGFAYSVSANTFMGISSGELLTQISPANGFPSVSTLIFHNDATNSTIGASGWIKRLVYYPTRLSNTQLQAITLT